MDCKAARHSTLVKKYTMCMEERQAKDRTRMQRLHITWLRTGEFPAWPRGEQIWRASRMKSRMQGRREQVKTHGWRELALFSSYRQTHTTNHNRRIVWASVAREREHTPPQRTQGWYPSMVKKKMWRGYLVGWVLEMTKMKTKKSIQPLYQPTKS